jgi:hypothetical protein
VLRKMLESVVGPKSEAEYRQVLDLATSDIKTNRIAFGKRTSLHDAVEIAVSCFVAMSRGKVA